MIPANIFNNLLLAVVLRRDAVERGDDALEFLGRGIMRDHSIGEYERTESRQGLAVPVTQKHHAAVEPRVDNGYTFPVYGATTADLTPISDFLALLAENNIYLALPELQISEKTDFDWISSQIADNFWLLYRPYHDGSRYVLQLQLPYSYRPMEEAFPLLLVSTLSIGITDADALFGTLQYNIVNDSCTLRTDSYTITYSEPRLSDGKLADFAVLEVEKVLK